MTWTPPFDGDGDGGDGGDGVGGGTGDELHRALRSLYSGLLDDHGVADTRLRLEGLGVRTAPAVNRQWSVTPFEQPVMSSPVVRCLLEHAVIALALAQDKATVVATNEQLIAALGARRVIEQAKGILMGRHRCDANAAFMLLVAQSQRENRKVREIASTLVDGIGDTQ